MTLLTINISLYMSSIETNLGNLQCVIVGCRRQANVLCYCCKENLCRNHYNEHDYLNSRLTVLADEIDSFDRQLLAIDIKKYIQNSNEKLQQWRFDGYRAVDQYCDQKFHEIEQYLLKIVHHKRDNIEQLRTSMLDFVQKRLITLDIIDSLTTNLHAIETELNDIDQKHLSITTAPLVIDQSCIHIEEIAPEDFQVSALPAAIKTIEYSRQGAYPIASNNQYLLIHREPNLCLVDRTFKVVKQTRWTYGQIFDMCWSNALSKFFLITLNHIFIFDVNTLVVERVETTQRLQWLSITCSDSSLFLSTNEKGSSICEFNLLNSLQSAKRWEPPDTCGEDERIHDMFFNKGALLLLIEDSSTERIRVELRSTTRFDRLWSLNLDIDYQSKMFSCTLLSYDQWLIVDSNTSRLFQITMNGKMKSSSYYKPAPSCACLFGVDLLAISTLQGVNIHKL